MGPHCWLRADPHQIADGWMDGWMMDRWTKCPAVGQAYAESPEKVRLGLLRNVTEIGRASCRERVCQYV